MKKSVLILLTCLFVNMAMAQVVYVDPVTTAAMATSAATLKTQQEKTNSNLKKIYTGQIAVAAELEVVKDLQDKILTGLTTVSDLLTDGIVAKYIVETTQDLVDEIAETAELAAENPEYAIFAKKSATDFYTRATKLGTEVTSVLTGGEKNMMDAGERHKLLNHIYSEIKILYAEAYSIKHDIKWAIRKGWWNSINPYSTWQNRDEQIMKEIMDDLETL